MLAATVAVLRAHDPNAWPAPTCQAEAFELERLADLLVDQTVSGCGSSLALRTQMRCAAQELVNHLPVAVHESRPALLFERISWLRPYLSHRGVDEACVQRLLESFAAAVGALAAPLPKARQYAQAAPATLGLPDRTPSPHVGGPGRAGAGSRGFARALLALDEEAAWRVAASLSGDGAGPEDVRSLIIEPALAEMGRLWQLNRLGAGRAQAAFLVARRVLARLPGPAPEKPMGAWAVVGAAPEERHTLGAALVGRALGRAGWRVMDLGAARATDVLAAVSDLEPRLVALSATEATTLPAFRSLVAQLRAGASRGERPPIRILAGGRIFALHEGLASDVGADAFAADPAAAVAIARRLAHDA